MLKIENVEIAGWEPAIHGMRNPMNSWDRSDSYFTYIEDPQTLEQAKYEFFAGENDLKLMRSLRDGGSEHRKFMRMIVVWLDITAPLYWWKEFDTYKLGTVANSCSTMHKIHDKEFTLDDFSCEHLRNFDEIDMDNEGIPACEDCDTYYAPLNMLETIIEALNVNRRLFIETKDKKFWWQMIQLLPSAYNQRRTVMLNYEVLANIHRQRRHHKLDEWHVFCDWIESLPYSGLMTGAWEGHE